MGTIVISENVSFDGVIEDPAGGEGFARGGWVGCVGEEGREDAAKILLQEALRAEVLLLDRHRYGFFAGRWPSRRGELADRLNSLPKYVVSATLEDPDWSNTTVLIDALRLMVYPVVLGAGEHLFGETREKMPMRRLDARAIGSDLALLTYEPIRE